MKKIKKYKKIIYGALILALVFGGNKIYTTYKTANPKVDYEIVKMEKRNLEKSISVDGQVVADYEITLASEIPGIISKVYVKEGDYVKKGQLLMKLRDTDYRNQINSAYVVQKINEVAYEKTKNPNHNLDIDKDIIQDTRESIMADINKTKADIQTKINNVELDLSQILRMDIDDYFAHTEFDDGYNKNPVFTYRLKNEEETEKLEKERKELGEEFKKYQNSKKNLENSIDIIKKFEKMTSDLYLASQDLAGYSERTQEEKENYLLSLRNKVVAYKDSLTALKTQLINLEKKLDSNIESEKKIENDVNPVDLEMAKEKIKQAQVQTHNAYTQLQKTYIRAPKAGVVVDVLKDEGEYAAPSMPLIKINSVKKYVEVNIPEVDIAKIKLGMPVEIKIDAFGDRIFKGKIDFIYPEKKEIFGVVYYKARILFTGKDWKKENILPGMSVEVRIPYEKKEKVLAIERGVAKKDGEKYFVEVLNPNKKRPGDPKFIRKYFKSGFVGDDFVEVVDSDKLDNFDIVRIKDTIKKK